MPYQLIVQAVVKLCSCASNYVYLVGSVGGWSTEDTKSMMLFWMLGSLDLILKWPIRFLRFQDRKQKQNYINYPLSRFFPDWFEVVGPLAF